MADEPARRPVWPAVLLVALLSLIPAIWAGDTPFTFDEPMLIGKALLANADGTWANAGLLGTLGRPYGPLPTWLYQVGLMFTSDLQTLVAVRAVLVTFATLVSAVWIARLLRLPFAWVLILAASPYLLFYARGLWDNSFNIPLAGLATALTFHAIFRRAIWPLPLLAAAYGAMLLVNPMALPLIAASLLVLGLQAKSILSPHGRGAGWIVIVSVSSIVLAGWFISAPYRAAFFQPPPFAPVVSDRPDGWWFALLSPRILSASWIGYFFPPGYLQSTSLYPAFAVAQWVTATVFVFAAAGAALAIAQNGIAKELSLPALFAAAVLAGQILLNGLTRTFGHPHYYNATWIAPALLVGIALARLNESHRRLCVSFSTILIAALLFTGGYVAVLIHSTHGTRYNTGPGPAYFGPTLTNQIAVAEAWQKYDPASPLTIEGKAAKQEALQLLFAITPAPRSSAGRPVVPLRIGYVHPEDPRDGQIALQEAPPAK